MGNVTFSSCLFIFFGYQGWWDGWIGVVVCLSYIPFYSYTNTGSGHTVPNIIMSYNHMCRCPPNIYIGIIDKCTRSDNRKITQNHQ